MPPSIGVLVMAYGTPPSLDALEGYYTHIRRGRPPTAELLTELQGRYEAIGGISPLLALTRAQEAAIGAALDASDPGRFVTALGQKHAAPFVEDGAAALADQGVDAVVGVVLAPHYSGFSVKQYHDRAAAALGALPYAGVDRWHLLPELVAFLSAAVREAAADLPERHKVLFTAHSLPERVLADGDPYPDELHASAAAVAAQAGLLAWGDWGLAWQSAGRTPEPWRGPDILDVIRQLADTGRSDGVLVCPQGFTADHLEVLYDLDIEARRLADDLGLRFERTRSINADAGVMGGLARLVPEHVDRAQPQVEKGT